MAMKMSPRESEKDSGVAPLAGPAISGASKNEGSYGDLVEGPSDWTQPCEVPEEVPLEQVFLDGRAGLEPVSERLCTVGATGEALNPDVDLPRTRRERTPVGDPVDATTVFVGHENPPWTHRSGATRTIAPDRLESQEGRLLALSTPLAVTLSVTGHFSTPFRLARRVAVRIGESCGYRLILWMPSLNHLANVLRFRCAG